jgi:hypothetical protein
MVSDRRIGSFLDIRVTRNVCATHSIKLVIISMKVMLDNNFVAFYQANYFRTSSSTVEGKARGAKLGPRLIHGFRIAASIFLTQHRCRRLQNEGFG